MSHVLKGIALTRFVFLLNREGLITCDIRFPIAGKFKLDLFSKEDSMNSYKLACSHVINAHKAAENAKPFPENTRSEWGPGPDLQKIGMKPLTHPDGLIEAEKGETEIKFEAQHKIDLLPKLHSGTRTTDDLSRYVVYYIVEEVVVVNVRMPEVDDYILNLYARRQDDSDKMLSSVCSYLISSSQPAADPRPFPISELGAVKNSTLEIKPVSHPAARVTAPDDSSHMDFTFNTSKLCRLLPELKYYRDGVEEDTLSFRERRLTRQL